MKPSKQNKCQQPSSRHCSRLSSIYTELLTYEDQLCKCRTFILKTHILAITPHTIKSRTTCSSSNAHRLTKSWRKTARKRTCSGATESCDVYSHVSGTPQAVAW